MVESWSDLIERGEYECAATRLIADSGVDAEALRENPWIVIGEIIDVKIRNELVRGCGGGGYYRSKPPTIYLHPAIGRRNYFTLLHEFGHHLQQNHDELAYALLDMNPHARKIAEEKISDSFASQVLMPLPGGLDDYSVDHPAQVMAGLFASSDASRSAVANRVKGLLPTNAKWVLVVADLEGTVQIGLTTYSDCPPAQGSQQPGLAALAQEAEQGPVRRKFPEGIEYSNGSKLQDMLAVAALDCDARYVFVGLTPEARFGTGQILSPGFECSNPACSLTVQAAGKLSVCSKCREPHCPECGSCGCAVGLTDKSCPDCNLLWTPEEVATGLHECW